MKKILSLLVVSSAFLASAATAQAHHMGVQTAGTVKKLTDKEIVLKVDKGLESFVITKKTQICADGFEGSLKDLSGVKVATVTAELGSHDAVRIDKGGIEFAFGVGGGVEPVLRDCKSKAK